MFYLCFFVFGIFGYSFSCRSFMRKNRAFSPFSSGFFLLKL